MYSKMLKAYLIRQIETEKFIKRQKWRQSLTNHTIKQ